MLAVWGILVALAVGALVGAIYFRLLLRTIQALPTARHPALLLLASFLGRITLVLGAFLLVTNGRWPRLLAALAGFLIARLGLTRRLTHQSPPPAGVKEARGDANNA